MDLKYDISNYIASVKMSSKTRILVEGRDDKSHIINLLKVILIDHNIKVDTAENIKGDCPVTAKNNRAKIEKVHSFSKMSSEHKNLFLFCDREFIKFRIDDKITDLMTEHESDGNLSWTIGHSLENYFIKEELVCRAYRFLCGSEYKNEAENLYRNIFSSALKLIATITLAAKKIDKCSYPGTIYWKDFIIKNDKIHLDIDKWKLNKEEEIASDFYHEFQHYLPVVEKSDVLICSRICRGHTAMLMLQRVFSACLYHVSEEDGDKLAEKIASDFSRIKESSLSSALSESWIQGVKDGNAIYPVNLLKLVG